MLRVKVDLLRQSIAVYLRVSYDRGLLFALRSFSTISRSDWLTWLLRQPYGEELVVRYNVVDDVFFVVRFA